MLLVPVVGYGQGNFDLEGVRQYKTKYQCPVSHPEYKKVLTELKDVQSRISSQSQCKEFSIDIKAMTELLTTKRKGFLDTINANKDKLLSPEATKGLQDYSSEVSEKALSIIDYVANNEGGSISESLFGTNRCILKESDKYDLISRTSSVVYEASNLLSLVSGPYGAPIAIGGNILAGVIKGVGTYLDKKKTFDFDDLDKRIFFSDTLCLYYQYQVEIDQLIHPQQTLDSFKKLDAHLRDKLSTLSEKCPECKELISQLQNGAVDNARIKEIDSKYSEPWGSHTKHAFDTLIWLKDQITKFSSIVNFPTHGIESSEIQFINVNISKFLFELSAPQFLDWYLYNFDKVEKKLASSVQTTVKNLDSHWINTFMYQHMISAYPQVPVAVTPLLYVADNNPKYATNPTFNYDFTELYRTWKLMESTQDIVEEYCNFFKQSSNYPKSIKSKCEGKKIKQSSDTTGWYAVGMELARSEMQNPLVLDFYEVNIAKYIKLLGDDAKTVVNNRIDWSNIYAQSSLANLSLKSKKTSTLPLRNWSEELDQQFMLWDFNSNITNFK